MSVIQYKRPEEDAKIFYTKSKEIIKRITYVLETTANSDKHLDPIAYYAFKGAYSDISTAIELLEQLEGNSKLTKGKINQDKPNKVLIELYDLLYKFAKVK